MLRWANTCLVILLASIFLLETGCHRSVESQKHGMWWNWKRRKHKDDGKNPFIKRDKATHKMSREQKREDDKMLLKQKRQYKRWQKKSKKKVGGG